MPEVVMPQLEMNFTKKALDLLPLPEERRRLEVYDTHVKGLLLRITSKGTRTFCVYRRVHGTPKRIKLGTYPDMAIEQARRAARTTLNTIAEGIDPVAERRAQESLRTTLSDAFEDYLKARRTKLKPRTVKLYREAISTTFSEWKDKPLISITKDMVENRHAERSRKSRAAADGAMRVLRAVFNYAAGKYEDADGNPIITVNPVSRLSTARQWNNVARRQTVIRGHELAPWFRAVLALEGEKASARADVARDYLLFLVLTGLRKNEAARLRTADVDLQAGTFTVADTKNRVPHTLPLSDYLQALARRRVEQNPEGYLFPGTGRTGHVVDVRYWIERVAEASGVTFCLHDLRRTFATVAESLDIPAYALKRLLNHKTGADVTAGYIVTDVERLRGPMQRITDFMLRTAGLRASAEIVPLQSVANERKG